MVDINESAILTSHCQETIDLESATPPDDSREDIEHIQSCDENSEKDAFFDASDQISEFNKNGCSPISDENGEYVCLGLLSTVR